MSVSIKVGTSTPPTTDVTLNVDIPSISIEDTGNQVDDTAAFEVLDIGLFINALSPEGHVLIQDSGKDKFNGFVQNLEPAWEGEARRFRISCIGVSMLLDKCIIPPAKTAYIRNNNESDRARIIWLLQTFGAPFLAAGSSSFAYIQTLEQHCEKQNFANMTLRQAIERVLGGASESGNYFIDVAGRLHTFDNDHKEDDDAPFKVKVARVLAADEIAPSDLRVNWDTSDLVNYYYVRGRDASGSGHFSDATSIAQYGRRQAFIDGPDSDTPRKARRLGRAALKDTKNPIVRCNFAVEGDYVTNGAGVTWKPGQKTLITSAAHGMTDYEIRIVRTTTSYLNGLGDKRVEIELGALRANFLGPDQWGIPGGGIYPDPTIVFPDPTFEDPPVIPPTVDPAPPAPILVDDFARTSGGAGPTYIDVLNDSSVGTSHTLYLVDGCNVAGRVLVLCVAWNDWTSDIAGFLDAQGFTIVSSDANPPYATIVAVRPITGSEGYTGTGDTVSFTTLNDGRVQVVSMLWDDIAGSHSQPQTEWIDSVSSTNTANPSSIAPSWSGDPAAIVTWLVTDASGTVTAHPAGFTALAYSSDGGGPHGDEMDTWASKKEGETTDPEDPGAYTTSSVAKEVWTIMLRGASGSSDAWGALPVVPGSPWEGGNGWVAVVESGDGTASTDGDFGIIELSADASSLRVHVASDGVTQPLGSWDEPTAHHLIQWKAGPFGSPVATSPNVFEIQFFNDDTQPAVRYHLGDAATYPYSATGQGLILRSGSDYGTFVPLTIVSGTLYYTRWAIVDGMISVKHWAASGTEPTTWTAQLALDHEEGLTPAYEMAFRLVGNTGTKLYVDDIYAQLFARTGTYVRLQLTGDGTTATFDLGLPFTQVRLVTVDGLVVANTTDDGQRITFDRPPASGAVIDIEVIAA
jgi:hypothetical protein